MSNKVFHLVVRFSDKLFSIGDVPNKHNEVVSRYGFVWFGKLGQSISQSRVDILNMQISMQTPTYIYLVQGNRKTTTVHRATLLQVAKELNKTERKFIPDYYTKVKILKYINTWFKISEIKPTTPSTLANLKAINSISPILETLARSSSGHFLVHESKDIF